MKIARNPPKKARIEIIPMIDTMFFLLVFFMIATLSMTDQSGLPVNLPQASGIKTDSPQVFTLTLTKDNKLFYEKEPIASPAAAALRLAQQSKDQPVSVIVNADRSVEHGRVIELMAAIRQSGITKIAVAVNPS
ncbi:biopolymer transporter ExbD|uniref:Biopolymer transport protein ExbD n=1 Tax=Dendrosporobacter quercicolus TaxID=146817 RepID=A0A1G9TQL7_9FIRM|nr:biopolymer transporter ExbD [Dendrosporobacter quercicolus]NSL48884.1 biopolymer transporter ExbD [Dendrosporobacter quercicolus DSM 1736]SDM50057.1 biopolymer transport protein ExbD [Dendrosporobacter quercicolus]